MWQPGPHDIQRRKSAATAFLGYLGLLRSSGRPKRCAPTKSWARRLTTICADGGQEAQKAWELASKDIAQRAL